MAKGGADGGIELDKGVGVVEGQVTHISIFKYNLPLRFLFALPSVHWLLSPPLVSSFQLYSSTLNNSVSDVKYFGTRGTRYPLELSRFRHLHSLS